MKEQSLHNNGLPLVSVIMPAYNAAQYIHQSIRSVQKQSLQHWELLVIDDASEDETAQIVLGFAQEDPRIKFHRNRTNLGTASSRNLGMELSVGQYVAFLDSDDIWHPEKLERQLAFLKETHADLVYCAYGYMDESSKRSCNYFAVPDRAVLEQMLKKNIIGCSTVMLARDVTTQFRFLKQYHFEDYVFWLSMLKAEKRLYGLQDVLVYYRIRKNSRSNNKLLCAAHRWHVYREFMGFSRAKSLYYMISYTIAGVIKYLNM